MAVDLELKTDTENRDLVTFSNGSSSQRRLGEKEGGREVDWHQVLGGIANGFVCLRLGAATFVETIVFELVKAKRFATKYAMTLRMTCPNMQR